jgi:hypothetical protein
LIYCFLYLKPIPCIRLTHRPDDGGSKDLWKMVNFYHTTYCYIPKDGHLRTFI